MICSQNQHACAWTGGCSERHSCVWAMLMNQDAKQRRRVARARASVMPMPLPMTPTLAPGASGTLNMEPFFDSAPVTKPVYAAQ